MDGRASRGCGAERVNYSIIRRVLHPPLLLPINSTMSSSRPELKVDDEVGFIKFFRTLESKGEETIRIFDRGDYYTAHGDDAVSIARTVGSPPIPSAHRTNTEIGLPQYVCPPPTRP
jgi:hypothetical protein